MMKQKTPSTRHARGRRAALLIAAALLAVLGCRGAALAQSAPTGPAGGDLTGTYPNPTLAADRVRKTGDTITGQLNVSIPNSGNVPVPFVLKSGGNPLSGRGVAMQFQVPWGSANGVGLSSLGGQITNIWGANAQTVLSFSAYNGTAIAEVFRLDGRGYVGVGTANPTSKLHVVSGTTSGTTLLSLDTGVSGGTSMAVFGTANNESGFDMSVARAGAYHSRFGVTAVAGHVYLQPGATGNVGVGTSAPGFRLDVQNGQVNASGGLCIAGDCKVSWAQVAGGSGSTQWTTSGTSVYYNSGSVGVGTATPNSAYKLDVGGSVNASGLCLGGDCKTAWSQVGGAASQWANGSSGVISYSSGSVGVGTATPTHSLEVAKVVAGDFGGLHVYNASGAPYNSADSVSLSLGRSSTHVMGQVTASNKLTGTFGDGYLALSTRKADVVSERVRIDEHGNFGIGTQSPGNRLHVEGGAYVNGDITATGNIAAKFQDVAEWVPSTQKLQAGTVVILDTGKVNHVLASGAAYDTKVAGVVSAQPGVILGEGGEGKVMVATTGRVKVKVDATRGAIKVGDLLVTSGVEGVAMKSVPVDLGGTPIHRPGTIIGKALEPLESGTGEILVLLSLQ